MLVMTFGVMIIHENECPSDQILANQPIFDSIWVLGRLTHLVDRYFQYLPPLNPVFNVVFQAGFYASILKPI